MHLTDYLSARSLLLLAVLLSLTEASGCRAQAPTAQANASVGAVKVSQAQRDAARKQSAEAAADRKKLVKLAKKKGWALEIKQADGRTISLVGVDERGMPQYMTTDPAKTPKELGPIPPAKREQTTAPSDSTQLKN